MERTALRLATIAALLNGGSAPWPTIAQNRVFDSRMDDIKDLTAKQRAPVIVVRTNDDENMYSGSAWAGRQCRLDIEMSVVTAATETVDGKEVRRLDWPQTDSAAEAMLDVLEWQAWNAIRGFNPWSAWYHSPEGANYGARVRTKSEPRFSSPDRGAVRLAVRTLGYLVPLNQECIAPPLHQLDPAAQPFLPPRLISILNYLVTNATGDFKQSVLEIARMIQRYGYVNRPRLEEFGEAIITIPQYELEGRASWSVMVAAETGSDTMAASGTSG